MRISDWSSDVCSSDLGSLAILRFEGGDRLAPVAGRLAQRVERGVIAFGDIAALRRVDRRRLDQRAGEFVNERAMAVERSEERRGGKERVRTCRFRWWPEL